MYPLGKASTGVELPKQSLDYFGLDNMMLYKQIVKEYRFKMLHDFWHQKNNEVTICFGKSYWNEFDNALNQDSSERVEIVPNKIYHYPVDNIYLVPFFGYRNGSMGASDLIEKLSARIRNDTEKFEFI